MPSSSDSAGGDFGPDFNRRLAAAWSTGSCQAVLNDSSSTNQSNVFPNAVIVAIMPPKKGKVIFEKHRSKPAPKWRKPKTGFLDLPLEVRDMIYGILLTEKTAMKPKLTCSALDVANYCHAHRPLFGLQPQILRVNHQSHEEGTRVLYGRNTFRFDDEHACCPHPHDDISLDMDFDEEDFSHTQESHDFKLFLIDIGQQNRLLLRKLEFNFTHVDVLGRGMIARKAVKIGRYPGKSFSDGFSILALGHSLQSLHITVDGCNMALEMEQRAELLNAICQVKQVPDLQITSTCKCDEKDGRNALGNIRYKLTKDGGSQAYKFKEGMHRWNLWGSIQELPALSGEASHEELATKIQKLSSEQRVLENRIAEDTERRDYIAKVLERTRSTLAL